MRNGIEERSRGGSISKPPYFQEGSGVTLTYVLPTWRFNDIIPGFLETYPNRKKAWFSVDVFCWDKSVSKNDPEINHPYNEVIYRIYVITDNKLGDYPLKLYLNDAYGIIWGKHFYAYPKYLADITVDKTSDKLFAHASLKGEELLILDVRKRGLANSLLTPLFKLYINRLMMRYTGPYNFKEEEGEVVNVPVKIENEMSMGKVEKAFFRDPVEWGVLSEHEASKPSYVFLWDKIDMSIDPPKIMENPWNERWRSGLNPSFKQFKYFEGIVEDEDGREYGLATSLLGNPIMYGEYAWLTDGDRWIEIYKGNKRLDVDGGEVETRDKRLSFRGNAERGWNIRAVGDDVGFDLFFKKTIKPLSHTFRGRTTQYNAYIYHKTMVQGEIRENGERKKVTGVGTAEHFHGSYAREASWRYFSMKSPETYIFATAAHYGRIEEHSDCFLVVTKEGMKLYDPGSVNVEILSRRDWVFTAEGEDGEVKANVHLMKDRPTNQLQPYLKIGLGPFTLVRTNFLEYFAEVDGYYVEDGRKTMFRGRGIAEEMDTIW